MSNLINLLGPINIAVWIAIDLNMKFFGSEATGARIHSVPLLTAPSIWSVLTWGQHLSTDDASAPKTISVASNGKYLKISITAKVKRNLKSLKCVLDWQIKGLQTHGQKGGGLIIGHHGPKTSGIRM